jgi:AcrR family transcriptional regulator
MPRISKDEKERVRQKLLMTAAEHFAAHGLAGANINEISTAAGYARGTVYNYYASKEELFGAVLLAGTAHTVARVRARGRTGDVREQLLALTEEDVRLVREHEDFMKVLAQELLSGRPETQRHIDTAIAPLHREVTRILLAGQRAGTIHTMLRAGELATLFLGQLTMLYVEHWRSDGAWPSWDDLPEVLVATFMDGARRPHQPR